MPPVPSLCAPKPLALLPPPPWPPWNASEIRLRDCPGSSSGSSTAATTATTPMRWADSDMAVFSPRLPGVLTRRPHAPRSSRASSANRSRNPSAAITNHSQFTGLRGTAPATV